MKDNDDDTSTLEYSIPSSKQEQSVADRKILSLPPHEREEWIQSELQAALTLQKTQ